jgi:hypothetical protein
LKGEIEKKQKIIFKKKLKKIDLQSLELELVIFKQHNKKN